MHSGIRTRFNHARRQLGVSSASAQVTSRQRLQQNYTNVRFHEEGNRVRAVYGTQMNRGNTPREAAEAWLAEYGEVFGATPLDLKEHQEMALDRRGRWAYLYNQTMEGLPVIGTSLRVLVQEGTPSHVLYAAGRIAARPAGGLPRATVTPDDALWAAKAHRTGLGLANWGQPELVVIYDDAPRGNGEAYPAWKCVGGNVGTLDSYSFYVHGLTGEVRRVHSNFMHAFDITGTVRGDVTPANTVPTNEILGPDTWDETEEECPNDAVTIGIEDALVIAYDPDTQAIVAVTRTLSDGSYSLDVGANPVVDLKAFLIGPGSEVYVDTYEYPWPTTGTMWGVPLGPQSKTSVMASASLQDFSFSSDVVEYGIANTNAHKHLSTAWNYLDLDAEILPPIPLVVNSDFVHIHTGGSGAFYIESGWCLTHNKNPCGTETVPWPGRLVFDYSDDGADPNAAYSTVISHEFGHYVLHVGFGIGAEEQAFHEGFADVLSHLVHDTMKIGQDFKGCGGDLRTPWTANHTYPECDTDKYERAQVLSKVWLNILQEMKALYGQAAGLGETQDLHRAWMPIAEAPGGHPTCVGLKQSASSSTLLQVLIADSPNDNPGEAPHLVQICDAFELQSISHYLCDEAARRLCYADCDGSGTLNLFDFLCFQDAFIAADLSSDCNGDGQLNLFDLTCFQAAFATGCGKE